MAEPFAHSYGSGIALQAKVPPKTSHLGENFLRGFQVGSNEKSKKKKEEADLLEFDSSAAAKLAPRNFQKYMQLQQEAVTQYKKDREILGADKARQLFIQKKYEPNGILENANKIVYSDTQAKQHLKESQDGNVAAQAALLSQYLQGTDDTDPVNTGKYDKLNQPDLGIQLTPEGYFQGVQYKKPNWETVFNNAKTNNTPDPKTLKNTPLANGHTLSTITSVPTPETEESLTGMAVSDQATFVDQIDKHRDEWKQMGYDIDNPDSAIRIPEQRRAFKEQFVSPQLRNKTSYYNIGQPRAEREGSGNTDGSNNRFAIRRVTPDTVREKGESRKYYEGGIEFPGEPVVYQDGYDFKDISFPENAPQVWKSDTYKIMENGRLVEKKNFDAKAPLIGVYKIDNKWVAAIEIPAHTEKREGKSTTVGKVTLPGKTEEIIVPAQTAYIPYGKQKSTIEAYTVDKKGNNGWVLPQESKQEKPKKTESQIPTIDSQAAYDNLKSGDQYYDTSGKLRRKK